MQTLFKGDIATTHFSWVTPDIAPPPLISSILLAEAPSVPLIGTPCSL